MNKYSLQGTSLCQGQQLAWQIARYLLATLPGSLRVCKNLIRYAHQSILQECERIEWGSGRKYRQTDRILLCVELWKQRFGVEIPGYP